MVELCKDRVGLLVDGDNEDRRLETWHCRSDTQRWTGQQQGSW
jgi:hypothetical protein